MTPEQGALIKKAQESLRAARLLAKDGLCDFAASRAYYVMFYVAQAFLLKEKLAYSKHSAVISAFGQRFAKGGRVPAEFHLRGHPIVSLWDVLGSLCSASFNPDPTLISPRSRP